MLYGQGIGKLVVPWVAVDGISCGGGLPSRRRGFHQVLISLFCESIVVVHFQFVAP